MNNEDMIVHHPYYCSEGNFYKSGMHTTYKNIRELIDAWKVYDVDLNYIFRWDINDYREPEYEGDTPSMTFQAHLILQRKAILRSISAPLSFEREEYLELELKLLREFLRPHWEKTIELWKPFSDGIKGDVYNE